MRRLWRCRIVFIAIVVMSCTHVAGKMERGSVSLAQGTIPYTYFVPIAPVNPVRYRTSRVSVASDGTEANQASWKPAISADGRFVAFYSGATNLVDDDRNEKDDVFVHDRQTGETTLVSVASDGSQFDGSSRNPSISASGRYVAFSLHFGPYDGDDRNIYVHDRDTGETTLISMALDGSKGNGASQYPSISGDGRYVSFSSNASNLVENDENESWDIFIRDRTLATTTSASIPHDDSVEFIYGYQWSKSTLSADGRYVLFSSSMPFVVNDTDGDVDAYLYNRTDGARMLVSIASDGTQAPERSLAGSISADGRYVCFNTVGENVVDIDTNGASDDYIHDRETGETTIVAVSMDGTAGNRDTYNSSISADGGKVAFVSYAENLVSNDINRVTDVFVLDRQLDTIRRISVSSYGIQGNNFSSTPKIAADGGSVVYSSRSSNLAPNDTNGYNDIFIYDMTE